MLTQPVTIVNRLGLHARAAARFVQTAAAFTCEVSVVKAGNKVNGKSIMGLMMLGAARGDSIDIRVAGPGAAEALAQIAGMVRDGFGEE